LGEQVFAGGSKATMEVVERRTAAGHQPCNYTGGTFSLRRSAPVTEAKQTAAYGGAALAGVACMFDEFKVKC